MHLISDGGIVNKACALAKGCLYEAAKAFNGTWSCPTRVSNVQVCPVGMPMRTFAMQQQLGIKQTGVGDIKLVIVNALIPRPVAALLAQLRRRFLA